jgi:hypothetical protein
MAVRYAHGNEMIRKTAQMENCKTLDIIHGSTKNKIKMLTYVRQLGLII